MKIVWSTIEGNNFQDRDLSLSYVQISSFYAVGEVGFQSPATPPTFCLFLPLSTAGLNRTRRDVIMAEEKKGEMGPGVTGARNDVFGLMIGCWVPDRI